MAIDGTKYSEDQTNRRYQPEALEALNLDPDALADDESFWSQVVDEMKFDLI